MKAFISYKWENDVHNEWVEKLATDLRESGIEAILDKWEVRLGGSFTNYMTSKIDEADIVLFIITTASVAAVEDPKGHGGAVQFEMQMATARRTAGEKMRLIGIYREGNKPPAHLRDHRYADFRNDDEYQEKLKELVDDLLGRTSRPPVIAPEPEKKYGKSGSLKNVDKKPQHSPLLYVSRDGRTILMVQTFADRREWGRNGSYHILDNPPRALKRVLKIYGRRFHPVPEPEAAKRIENAVINILDLNPDVLGLGGMGRTAIKIRSRLQESNFNGEIGYWGADAGNDAGAFLRMYNVDANQW